MTKLSDYGPAVVGQKKFDEMQQERRVTADVFGPAVVGAKKAPKQEVVVPDTTAAHLSIRDLEAMMDVAPAKMDHYLSAEWEREGGARRSALRIFLKMEMAKEEKLQRQVLIDRITEYLNQ